MKIIVCSIPKSGTYLLNSLLKKFGWSEVPYHFMPDGFTDYNYPEAKNDPDAYKVKEPLPQALRRVSDDHFAVSHLPSKYAADLKDFEVIFAKRNLRDCIASYCRWNYSTNRWVKRDSNRWRERQQPEDRLVGFLCSFGYEISKHFADVAQWQSSGLARVEVSFENLLGDQGLDEQRTQVVDLANIGCTVDTETAMAHLNECLSTGSLTKSSGRTDWRAHWSDQAEAVFRKIGLDDLNGFLGYEIGETQWQQIDPAISSEDSFALVNNKKMAEADGPPLWKRRLAKVPGVLPLWHTIRQHKKTN